MNDRLPDLAYLRVIGSKAWVLILKSSKNHKFMSRATICRLLGYVGINQYILWDSESDRIIYTRDVAIDEWNTIYNEIQNQIRGNDDENIGNLLYKSDYEMEDVVEPNKLSQLENYPSQPENTSIQSIPISIDINDLIDEYAGVDKRENHQNRRDDDYVEKEMTDQNRQSQQVKRNYQNIRVDDYVKEELTNQNQQS